MGVAGTRRLGTVKFSSTQVYMVVYLIRRNVIAKYTI